MEQILASQKTEKKRRQRETMDTCAPVFAEQIELQEHNGLRDSSILINASGSHPCRNAMLESKLTSQPHHRTNE